MGHFKLPSRGGIRIQSSPGKIIYEQLGQRGDFQLFLPHGEYTVVLRDSMVWGKPVLNLASKWAELAEVTKYREVAKNYGVPVEVEKQRSVTRYKKASLWEMLFGISSR